MRYEPIPRWKQRLGGLFIALLGGGIWAWEWYTVFNEGHYYVKAALIFPAFCIMGFGLTIFPGYKEERIARGEDISNLSGAALITIRWWVILLLALTVGFGNLFMLSR